MKPSFLSRLQRNGSYYISGAVLLLAAPLYQSLILLPQGYSAVQTSPNGSLTTLMWIGNHSISYLGYRLLLVLAFAFFLTLPFTLFRIIVAQELEEEQTLASEEAVEEQEDTSAGEEMPVEELENGQTNNSMPPDAWRGKGFAVIAAWSGLLGLILTVLGATATTLYLAMLGTHIIIGRDAIHLAPTLSSAFTVLTNTAGGGLLALSCLFFGAVIARRGRYLWPGIWVWFSYVALALAALYSASAVEVASAPTDSQQLLTTPAILVFALWALWFGIMLVRLRPER